MPDLNDTLLIIKAADFSAKKHRDQRRKDHLASPYINHPIEVASLLVEVGGVSDPQILAAALLHDTLEDTKTSREELERIFGAQVCLYVEQVTDDKSLPKEERKRLQIEHAEGLTPGAAMVKIADKISNIKDVIANPPAGWNMDRRRNYLIWAQKVVDACPPVNEALKKHFDELLESGLQQLGN